MSLKSLRKYKLQPFRRKSRRIGRNELCPCGRTKWIEVPVLDEYFYEDGRSMPVKGEVQVHVKWKHCCGDIDNQRKIAAVKRNIKMAVKWMMAKKQDNKKGFIKKLVGFFGRGE